MLHGKTDEPKMVPARPLPASAILKVVLIEWPATDIHHPLWPFFWEMSSGQKTHTAIMDVARGG